MRDKTETPEDDDSTGVLGDPTSIDTSMIGTISGISHVDVNLAVPEEDDADDDVVLDDDITLTEAVVVDEGDEETDEGDEPAEGGDADGDTPEVDPDDDADEPDVLEEPDEVIELEGPDEAADELDEESIDGAVDDDVDGVDGAEATADDASDDEVAEVAADDADVAAEDAAELTEEDAAEPTAPAAAVPAVRAPRTRAAERHERVRPRTSEIVLEPRRIGDTTADQETSDLLTADRLLDPARVSRPEPEGTWAHLLYRLSGGRINIGDSKRVRERKALDARIAQPLDGDARFVPVLSRKGGVGKTTVTTLLGMALADARDDRVIAIDANPDRGTLADRVGRSSGRTVRDLVRERENLHGFNDFSQLVGRDETRLDVLASDTDPHVSEAFNDQDYLEVAEIAAHYYSIVLTDTGTGIVHSVMESTLECADQLVIVTGLSVDEARLASETLNWLDANGYEDRVRGAIVVLNSSRPGAALVRAQELESHFGSRVRAVVHIPYDAHIAAGSAVSFRDLDEATRLAARELAATVVAGLRNPGRR